MALNINQWRSTVDYIRWFENAETSYRCAFIKYDIKDFYPSITEKVFREAIKLAKDYVDLSSNMTSYGLKRL